MLWIVGGIALLAFITASYGLWVQREAGEDLREVRMRLDNLLRQRELPGSGDHHVANRARRHESWTEMQQRLTREEQSYEQWADYDDWESEPLGPDDPTERLPAVDLVNDGIDPPWPGHFDDPPMLYGDRTAFEAAWFTDDRTAQTAQLNRREGSQLPPCDRR